MNITIQLYNTFRNRWCGAYLANKGIKVIPTVNWANEDTFDFCFEGIEKGSIVAVSTYMVQEHNNHSDQKEFFMKGYNEMLRRIEPSKIICYSEPFPEMQGDIIYIDYELSGWKYLKGQTNALNNKTKSGRIIHKIIVQPDDILKGTWSAYGGKWKPKKPEDERFLGEPDTIKTFYFKYRIDVKYDSDGRATIERHYTDHKTPWKHSDPHDHYINWNEPRYGQPSFEKPHINYYGDIPEFKKYGDNNMKFTKITKMNSLEDNRFKTISDFKDCIIRGGEVEFNWKGKSYSITHPEGRINIGEGCYEKDGKYYNVNSHTEYSPNDDMWGDTADEILEYIVSGDRLRDVITQVEVIVRTI